MKNKFFVLISLLWTSIIASSATFVPINDTILLKSEHIEGRWIEEVSSTDTKSIYIFRDDNTFHKANDNGELLFFNIVGRYRLSSDSIKIYYQDYSRKSAGKVKVQTMHFQVISLSEDELNINKTEKNNTEFIRLRRQNQQ